MDSEEKYKQESHLNESPSPFLEQISSTTEEFEDIRIDRKLFRHNIPSFYSDPGTTTTGQHQYRDFREIASTAVDAFSYNPPTKRRSRRMSSLHMEAFDPSSVPVTPILNFPLSPTIPEFQLLSHHRKQNTKSLISGANEPHFFVLNADGTITTANESACGCFGIELSASKAISFLDLVHPDFSLKYKAFFNSSLNDDIVLDCGSIILAKTQNQIIPVSIWLKRKQRGNQTIFLCVIQEIHGDVIRCSPNLENSNFQIFKGTEYHNKHVCVLDKTDNQIYPAISIPSSLPLLTSSVIENNTHASEAESQFLLLNTCSGVVVLDEKKNIQSLNHSFIQYLTGYSGEELKNKPISTISKDLCKYLDSILSEINGINIINNSEDKQTSVLDSAHKEYQETHRNPSFGKESLQWGQAQSFAVQVQHSCGAHIPLQAKVVNYLATHRFIAVWLQFSPLVVTSPTILSTRTSSPVHESPQIEIPEDIQLDNLRWEELLGEGNYSYVREASLHDHPEVKLVVKMILKNRVLQESWVRFENRRVPREIMVLEKLKAHSHPNIVKMIKFDEDFDFFYLFLQRIGSKNMDLFEEWLVHDECKNMKSYLESSDSISQKDIKYIFKQILKAVGHLHSLNIVHRDLKDENIIIDQNLRVTLIDFGSSAFIEGKTEFSSFAGTLAYAPPEIIQGTRYTGPPQDIWALGIILYCMQYKKIPYRDMDDTLNGNFHFPAKSFDDAESFKNLVLSLMQYEPVDRPTIEEISKHEWLQ